MWKVNRTNEFLNWIKLLDLDGKEAILAHIMILKEIGPNLGRPYVDTVYQSRHKNMKELRIQNKVRIYRIFFAFDQNRNAILLVGGDKKGKKDFYNEMINKADKLFDCHMRKLEKNNE